MTLTLCSHICLTRVLFIVRDFYRFLKPLKVCYSFGLEIITNSISRIVPHRRLCQCCNIAKFHYTDTDTDPHGLFLRRNSVGSVRVRSGPCSGI